MYEVGTYGVGDLCLFSVLVGVGHCCYWFVHDIHTVLRRFKTECISCQEDKSPLIRFMGSGVEFEFFFSC